MRLELIIRMQMHAIETPGELRLVPSAAVAGRRLMSRSCDEARSVDEKVVCNMHVSSIFG